MPVTAPVLTPPPPAGGMGTGLQTLQGLCQQAAREATDRTNFLQRLGQILARVLNPDVIVRIFPNAAGELQLDGLLHPAQGLTREYQQGLGQQGQLSMQRRTTHLGRLGRPPSILMIAVPVLQLEGCQESLAALFTAPPASPDVLIAVMELVVAQLALWDARHARSQRDDVAESAAAVVDLLSRLEAATGFPSACQILVQELSQFLGGPAVAYLRSDQGRLRLQAFSSETQPADDLLDQLLAAGDEAVIRGEPGLWPPRESHQKHCLLTHRQLALRLGAECVCSFPLIDEQSGLQGVLLVVGDGDLMDDPDRLQFLQSAAVPLAGCLRTLQRAERPKWQRRIDTLISRLFSSTGRWIALGLLLGGGALMIPVPYRISCECELQPVTRRYVVAPFEGQLEKSLVEPGDVVVTGQILAQLDGREIQWELEGAEADLHRSLKERDGHLASGKYGDAELSRLEAERLRLKSELLRHRGDRLEIASPIAGIVVSGDLRRTEGAPVQVGQTLFEVAPLDAMTIEVRIPEREIAYVQPGQAVDVTLDAFPGRHWPAVVETLHPRAQLHQDQHIFLAEIDVPNEHELLRPGMQGQARLTTKARPLGWNLFHHAWEKLALWAGW